MFKPLGESGTLVLRGEYGRVIANDKLGVPSTFLFRAGGDQSVRGYGYQQLGVQEADAIVGGRYLLTAAHTGPDPYQYPERRVLTWKHFESALRQVPASISENMASLP